MNLVHRRTKVMRSSFRQLPFGALYWLASALNVAPSVKVGRRLVATGFSTNALTTSSVSDTSVAVVRVQPYFLTSQ